MAGACCALAMFLGNPTHPCAPVSIPAAGRGDRQGHGGAVGYDGGAGAAAAGYKGGAKEKRVSPRCEKYIVTKLETCLLSSTWSAQVRHNLTSPELLPCRMLHSSCSGLKSPSMIPDGVVMEPESRVIV